MVRKTRFWRFMRATSMRASLSWMSWNSPMGRPNCTRSRAYLTESSRQRSTMPSAMAATPERSIEKVSLAPESARLRALPPSRRSAPAETSCRKSSRVGELCRPILRSGLLWVRPGMPRSSTKFITFQSRRSTPSSSSLQTNTIVSA